MMHGADWFQRIAFSFSIALVVVSIVLYLTAEDTGYLPQESGISVSGEGVEVRSSSYPIVLLGISLTFLAAIFVKGKKPPADVSITEKSMSTIAQKVATNNRDMVELHIQQACEETAERLRKQMLWEAVGDLVTLGSQIESEAVSENHKADFSEKLFSELRSFIPLLDSLIGFRWFKAVAEQCGGDFAEKPRLLVEMRDKLHKPLSTLRKLIQSDDRPEKEAKKIYNQITAVLRDHCDKLRTLNGRCEYFLLPVVSPSIRQTGTSESAVAERDVASIKEDS